MNFVGASATRPVHRPVCVVGHVIIFHPFRHLSVQASEAALPHHHHSVLLSSMLLLPQVQTAQFACLDCRSGYQFQVWVDTVHDDDQLSDHAIVWELGCCIVIMYAGYCCYLQRCPCAASTMLLPCFWLALSHTSCDTRYYTPARHVKIVHT